MTKKLRNLPQLKIDPGYRRYLLLPNIILIIIYFFSISQLSANSNKAEDLTNYPKIVKSYSITDASTEGKSCFPTKGKGVIFQRADGCQGSHHIWSVYDKLTLNEYDNETATIVGSVVDENGKIGKVNIALYNKKHSGNTWQAACYQEGITDPRSLYQAFNGTITIDGKSFSVALKQAEQHYILADGAGFQQGRFGFGAWTGGSFGGCTEWFGNLDPIEVNCDLTVDAGEDVSECKVEEVVLTANVTGQAECTNIISSYKIIDSETEAGCFTADPGVIFTKGENCNEKLVVWSAKPDLELNEYDDDTAKITGHVVNQYGKIGIVDITLTDKEHSGNTWNASCYLDGISGPETFYRSFNGTITVDGLPLTVGTRFNAHYILANGAGFDSNQYGLGAWTGGSFGSCTEWFGNLVPKPIDNSNNEITYQWSTTDGNIVGDAKQKTVTVDSSGTYTVSVTDCMSCEATDAVIVSISNPKAYALEGGDEFCIDGEADYLTDATISVYGDPMGTNSTFVVTDLDGKILGLPGTLEAVKAINFDEAGTGTCLIWHLSFEDALQGAAEGNNANDLEGCFELSNPIEIVRSPAPKVEAGDDQTICEGEEVMLTAEGEGAFLWSTGETTKSIMVSPETTTEYRVTVTNGNCEASDEVTVSVDDKVVIGDYVWLDENRNGIQDDGQIGVKDISVKLYRCDGELIDETKTNDDGYYEFKVCPDSGEYQIVFGNVLEGLKFTTNNEGDDILDSDADMGGKTTCFTINDEDDLTIDAGLIEICDIDLEVIEEVKMCGEQVLELTATLTDNTEECEGGCVYPIIEQDRCYGPTGNFDIWLVSLKDGKKGYHRFKASEQRFETFEDGSARYTAKAIDGTDEIEVDVLFTENTSTPGPNGAYPNECQQYDMSDWEYWSTWSGIITSKNHGIFNLSTKGKYFQMGIGADVVRTGFGASGWFFATGGDGYYTDGDINVVLDECIEKSATFEWTTVDGNIIGDANQKTITIDRPGTYVIEAVNCIDCVAVKTVVVTEDIVCSTVAKSATSPKMSTVYPVPVKSGGTLTIEFDLDDQDAHKLQAKGSKAKATGSSNKEDVSVVLYDMMGRTMSTPRTFDLINGKAVIYLDLDFIPSGKYIVKAQGSTWNHSKNIIVR